MESQLQSKKYALVETFGCRQNSHDTELIKGQLTKLGYEFTTDRTKADLIIFNTCAVREGAEDKVYGNLGILKKLKLINQNLVIGICGCMSAQPHVQEKIQNTFTYVDFLLGTKSAHKIPEILLEIDRNAKKKSLINVISKEKDEIIEDVPVHRDYKITANVPIMYGCNNFCSYCVVPHVRGRERSRNPKYIIKEIENLVSNGAKEILLLGQNVNSYGKTLETPISFAELLKKICKIPGLLRVRFISSHPKDFSDELIDVIANEPKICKQLHLPFQAGSNQVLRDMNRKYTREDYLTIINKIKGKMPQITLTSDVIVGFPTETLQDFEDTLTLVQNIEFNSLFTFIYSPRIGTVAQKMKSIMTDTEKKDCFDRLIECQNEISLKKNRAMVGGTYDILVEGYSKTDKNKLAGRTEGGIVVNFEGGSENCINQFVPVKILTANTWSLSGEYCKID